MVKRKSEKKQSKTTKNTPKSSNGIGDTVEKVLKATGIDKVAKFVLGEDCGCEERKKTLNYLFPYRKPECLTEDEFNYLDKFIKEDKNEVPPEVQQELVDIYNRVFKDKADITTCSTCFKNNVYNKLKRVHQEYING
jgi:hypothetical protein